MHGCIQVALCGDLRALRAGPPVAVGDPAKSRPGAQSQAGVGDSRVPSEKRFPVSASTSFLSTLWSRDRRHHPLKVTLVMVVVVNLLTWHLWAGVTTIKQQQPLTCSAGPFRRPAMA